MDQKIQKQYWMPIATQELYQYQKTPMYIFMV